MIYGTWTPGMQIKHVRRPHKDVPIWANNDADLWRQVAGLAALRRYKIAYLYWRVGWTTSEISKELGLSINSVRSTLYRLRSAKTIPPVD